MRRKSLFFLSLAAILGIILYSLGGWGFDWDLFFSSLWNVQPVWLAVSIALTFLTYVFRGLRWQVLLSPLKAIPMGLLVSTNVIGFSAIFVLGRAGEVIRPLWLTRREHIPLTASVATVIIERFLDALMVIALFGWALLLVKLPSAADHTVRLMKDAAWVMVASSIGALVFLFFFRSNIERIVRYIPFAKLTSVLRNFSKGLSFLEQGRSLILATAHSLSLWIVIALQFWFMLLGMNFHFSVPAATLVMVGSAIGSIAQVPGIGGGFQAGYVFCMRTFFGVPPEQAIASSLVAWASSYIPTVIVAAWYMISHGLSLKDLRAATAE